MSAKQATTMLYGRGRTPLPLPVTPDERQFTWGTSLFIAVQFYAHRLNHPDEAIAERAAQAVFDLEKTRLRHNCYLSDVKCEDVNDRRPRIRRDTVFEALAGWDRDPGTCATLADGANVELPEAIPLPPMTPNEQPVPSPASVVAVAPNPVEKADSPSVSPAALVHPSAGRWPSVGRFVPTISRFTTVLRRAVPLVALFVAMALMAWVGRPSASGNSQPAASTGPQRLLSNDKNATCRTPQVDPVPAKKWMPIRPQPGRDRPTTVAIQSRNNTINLCLPARRPNPCSSVASLKLVVSTPKPRVAGGSAIPDRFPVFGRSRATRTRPTTMLDKVRNIGIMAHVDAGKTTTTERILYYSGTKHKVGDVDDGDTTTDFDPLERQKGITINSAAVSIDWQDHDGNDIAINIIDTPGHVDFTAEVERSLRVLDGAIGVFCAKGGVEVQSETVWRQATKYKVPRIAYVNKLDRMGANFWACVDQMKSKLRANPVVVTIPAGQDEALEGIIDLIRMKLVTRDVTDKTHRKFFTTDIPEKYAAEAAKRREQMLDGISAASDEIMEAVLEGKDVSEKMILAALRKGTLENIFTPVHCGSSKMFHGVQQLLDLVVDCLPSPLDRPPVDGIHPKTKEVSQRKPDASEPLSALAFKTVAETNGDLVYIRVYSGELKPGETYANTTTGKKERIARFYRMMGDKRISLEKAGPGEIVAAMGLADTFTGNTLSDPDKPVALEAIQFPKPVIAQALTFAKTLDAGKVGEALNRLVRDDPTLKTHTDDETKDTIISGMGELHLEISIEKLKRAIGVPQEDTERITLGKPRVAYRQCLSRTVDFEYKFQKQTGGRGKFAVIVVKYSPLTPEQVEEKVKAIEELKDPKIKPDPNNVYFVNSITQGSIPKEFIPSVEEGLREAAKKGYKYPFPFVDLEFDLHFGKYHDVDSSQDAFYLCALEAFREAESKAGITLLEPIMKVVVVSPKDYQGQITGNISSKRGVIEETSEDAGVAMVTAKIPLAKLFGYTSELRSATKGQASFSMEFSHYAPVPVELADLPPNVRK